jgi:NADPH:quinone reductase-like Zn-dependent oxidoreductase
MSDGAGVVEVVGEGVTEFKVNDRVVSCFFPNWADGAPAVADFSTVPYPTAAYRCRTAQGSWKSSERASRSSK